MIRKKIIIFLHFFLFSIFNVAFCNWIAPPTIVSSDTDINHEFLSPRIVMNNSGYCVTAWSLYDDASGDIILQASTSLDFGVTWLPVSSIDITNPSQQNLRPQVTIDQLGRAIIIWQIWDGAKWIFSNNNY